MHPLHFSSADGAERHCLRGRAASWNRTRHSAALCPIFRPCCVSVPAGSKSAASPTTRPCTTSLAPANIASAMSCAGSLAAATTRMPHVAAWSGFAPTVSRQGRAAAVWCGPLTAPILFRFTPDCRRGRVLALELIRRASCAVAGAPTMARKSKYLACGRKTKLRSRRYQRALLSAVDPPIGLHDRPAPTVPQQVWSVG